MTLTKRDLVTYLTENLSDKPDDTPIVIAIHPVELQNATQWVEALGGDKGLAGVALFNLSGGAIDFSPSIGLTTQGVTFDSLTMENLGNKI